MFIGLKKIFDFFQGVEKRRLRQPRLVPAPASEIRIGNPRVFVSAHPASPSEMPPDTLDRILDESRAVIRSIRAASGGSGEPRYAFCRV
jgi:hypothetical protein